MLTENESVIFIGNKVNSTGYSSGGALDTDTRIQISNNGEVQFVENAASGVRNVFGGAIYGFGGTTLFSDNARICFRGNSSTSSSYAYGGAIGFEGFFADAVRYFLIVLAGAGAWPMTFGFFSSLGKKKGSEE